MKAAVFDHPGPPDVLRYDDVPDPVCPPDGVVVRVEAISIEGGDTLHRGNMPVLAPPYIVGYQCAGVVAEAGPQATDRRVGDRVVAVMMAGSHAELAAVPTASITTWPVPDGMPIEEAACIPVPFGTADDCLFEFGRLRAGETVLVQAGGGGVGIAAIQLAKEAGATVLATASSDAKLERLAEFGLDHGINYQRDDFVARAKELTGGRGPDLVVDSVGGRVLAGSITAAAYRGRVITVGYAGRDEHPVDPRLLTGENKTLTGVFLGAELFLNGDRVHAMIERHIGDVAAGHRRVVIDRSFPLADAAEAHRYVESRRALGRVLLIP